MDRPVAGVEDQVRGAAQLAHHGALGADALEHRELVGERMRPARLREAPHQRLVRRLEEDQRRLDLVAIELAEEERRLGGEARGAHVHHHGDVVATRHEVERRGDELAQQRQRKIVDAVVAEILETLGDGALSRSGKAGHQDEPGPSGACRFDCAQVAPPACARTRARSACPAASTRGCAPRSRPGWRRSARARPACGCRDRACPGC